MKPLRWWTADPVAGCLILLALLLVLAIPLIMLLYGSLPGPP